MTRILFLFIDGVGLGPDSPENPLSTLDLPSFRALAGRQPWTSRSETIDRPDHVFRPIDATLGLEGLPQSGTGQATLLTGENAARIHGRHFGPYPPTTVRPTVQDKSVFAQLAPLIGTDRLAFANAYPERFFQHVEARGRWTVTTLAARSAGVRLRREADVRDGIAIPADLTGRTWQRLFDADAEPISEAEAARRLVALLDDHTFVLHEYYLTDKAGHSQDPARAASVLESLDRLFAGVLEAAGPDDVLLITSDHGNIEDLGTKSHTRHPVPLVAWGAGADAFSSCRSLLDVTPTIVELLTR
ncbi:peptidase [Rubrivirga sp.]|uniref:peptidase n=1 Tax=Rubrivirga sp. TaxID=1885344 RepID=UPI003C720B73